jgi:hypothetical protein
VIDIKFENLEISSDVHYYIETLDTDYRTNADIFLTVRTSGKAHISAGINSNNPHFLQNNDLHNGEFKTPYFAYKSILVYPNVDTALAAYNQWKNVKGGAE